jgi:DMSO/TMAO reductase YedYZ molybdopterin-dependent catalytic subunit
MPVISRGFGSRRRGSDPELPPGQYLTTDFPVLSAGPTPDIDTADWQFVIRVKTERYGG